MLLSEYISHIETMLDTAARNLGYDSVLSAVSYRNSVISEFHNQAEAFAAWRDTCWSRGYEVMAKVQAGEIPEPTLEELDNMLPTLSI